MTACRLRRRGTRWRVYVQVFVSMDAMVGKDFEAGLASLKTLAER